jgi:hypothetical protein
MRLDPLVLSRRWSVQVGVAVMLYPARMAAASRTA